MTVDELVENFELLGDWDQRYQYISELGARLPPLPDAERSDQTRVHGCMSRVWISGAPRAGSPQLLDFHGDSDTPIVKGLVAMLLLIYSGLRPQQVLDLDVDALIERLNLAENLSSNRHLGMYAMVERIRDIARSYLQ
jgi:cysteine desulfuration protein SufE